MVTLTTGNGSSVKKFVVHKDFACHYSPVLQAAFNGDFIEGRTRIYPLGDVEQEVVSLLVNWFYTQEIILESLERDECVEGDWGNIPRLWVLADKLLIPRLQNACISKLVELEEKFRRVATGILHYVYSNTAKGSPLRLLLLHQCTCLMELKAFMEHPTLFPHEMLLELAFLVCSGHRKVLIETSGVRSNLDQYKVTESPKA